MAGYVSSLPGPVPLWELEVNGLAGRLCHLELPRERLQIGDIKEAIQEAIGVHVDEQRLFLNSNELIKALDPHSVCMKPLELTLVRRSAEQVQWLQAVSKEGKQFASAPLEARRDKEILLEALRQDWHLLKHAPADLQEEIDIIEVALENGASAARVLPKTGSARSSKRLAKAAVKFDGSALQHFAPEVMEKDIVMVAVKQYPSAFDFLPKCFREDREVLHCAVQNDGTCLSYASSALQGDMDLVLAAVQQEGMALEYASPELQANRSVVLEAVRGDGCALQFASDELRADPETIRCALNSDGLALEFADENMRNREDLVLMAIECDPRALGFASSKLRNDANVVLAAFRRAMRGYDRESDRAEDRAAMLDAVMGCMDSNVLADLRQKLEALGADGAVLLDRLAALDELSPRDD